MTTVAHPRRAQAGTPIVETDVVLRLAGVNLAGLVLIVLGAVRSGGESDASSVVVWINVALVGVAVSIAVDAWALLELRRSVRLRSHGVWNSASGIAVALAPSDSVVGPLASSSDESSSSEDVTSEGERIRWHHRPDCILQRGHRSTPWSCDSPMDRSPCPVCLP